MTLVLYQVDAFTAHPFKGNPAGVCLLDGVKPDGWMQAVAAEMNLSETAFLLPEGDGYRLRWFTPAVEVDLCGHATLASAHVLFETERTKPGTKVHFYTRSGLLTAEMRQDWIELDFPAKLLQPCDPPAGLLQALGVEETLFVGRNQSGYLVEVSSEDIVRSLQPNFAMLKELPVRGVIVTSKGSAEYDFISRFFAPKVGVNEDPVTGSAHCRLAPYWAGKLGKNIFRAYQASARGGVLKVEYRGERVLLAGQAVTIFKAELLV